MSKVPKVRILSWLGRTKINLILFLTYRTNFQEFLRRPDHKQDFVAQWQADFNSVPEDLWEDEETKAELHQRVNVRTAVPFCARVISFSLPRLYTPTSSYSVFRVGSLRNRTIWTLIQSLVTSQRTGCSSFGVQDTRRAPFLEEELTSAVPERSWHLLCRRSSFLLVHLPVVIPHKITCPSWIQLHSLIPRKRTRATILAFLTRPFEIWWHSVHIFISPSRAVLKSWEAGGILCMRESSWLEFITLMF